MGRRWGAGAAGSDGTRLTCSESGRGNPAVHRLVQLAVAGEGDPGGLIAGLGADDVPQENRPHGFSEHHLYRRRPRGAQES